MFPLVSPLYSISTSKLPFPWWSLLASKEEGQLFWTGKWKHQWFVGFWTCECQVSVTRLPHYPDPLFFRNKSVKYIPCPSRPIYVFNFTSDRCSRETVLCMLLSLLTFFCSRKIAGKVSRTLNWMDKLSIPTNYWLILEQAKLLVEGCTGWVVHAVVGHFWDFDWAFI